MLLALQILFWLSIIALLHTYIFYPYLLQYKSKNKHNNTVQFRPKDTLPHISVLMAVHNEEKVIRQKMDSLLGLSYPKHLIQIYIGSDCSSDATNPILAEYQKKDARIHFFPFTKRQGKPGIINQLAETCTQNKTASKQHIFLLTDASVILQEDTLWHLIKHFKNPEIAIVDSNMVHFGIQQKGISASENQYITNEVLLKHHEGILWGKMIGPFGGCYAIRSDFFTPVPPKFLVDDFFIAMKVLEQNKLAINDLEAICHESVSHEIAEEYRRKARISAGNFQNLHTFKHLLQLNTPLGFAFFSHKVLRWFGPFFILLLLLTSAILAYQGNYSFKILFFLQLFGLFGIPILDKIFKTLHIHIRLFRNITYFNYMNLALLNGFFNYLKGIQTNVWEPPKRN